jgi:hypothetical protein
MNGDRISTVDLWRKLGYPPDNRGREAWEEIAENPPGVVMKISMAKDASYRNRQIIGQLDDDDEGISFLREFIDRE